jgi:NAD(P)-dependent dehydrogenase (short-subunit alcohol dehydrogenase family)
VQAQIEARSRASGKTVEEEKVRLSAVVHVLVICAYYCLLLIRSLSAMFYPQVELVSEKHPTKGFAKPEDIAQLVVFLCSPHANQVSGAEVSICVLGGSIRLHTV